MKIPARRAVARRRNHRRRHPTTHERQGGGSLPCRVVVSCGWPRSTKTPRSAASNIGRTTPKAEKCGTRAGNAHRETLSLRTRRDGGGVAHLRSRCHSPTSRCRRAGSRALRVLRRRSGHGAHRGRARLAGAPSRRCLPLSKTSPHAASHLADRDCEDALRGRRPRRPLRLQRAVAGRRAGHHRLPTGRRPKLQQQCQEALHPRCRQHLSFLARFAPELGRKRYGKEIWQLYERGELDPEVELTGSFTESTRLAHVGAILDEIDAARDAAMRKRGERPERSEQSQRSERTHERSRGRRGEPPPSAAEMAAEGVPRRRSVFVPEPPRKKAFKTQRQTASESRPCPWRGSGRRRKRRRNGPPRG